MPRREPRPSSYNRLRRRVEDFDVIEVVIAAARVNAALLWARLNDAPAPELPTPVQQFTLAGVARTALIDGRSVPDGHVEDRDLFEMCALYFNIGPKNLTAMSGMDRLRLLMGPLAYEQFGHQSSEMEHLGRTVVLLEDHASASPKAPTPSDWTAGLGVSLQHFLRLAFAVLTAASSNGGLIDRAVLESAEYAPIYTPATTDQALETVDRWFAATPEELRETGRKAKVRRSEKWSLNPLVERPLVRLPDGRYVLPWPHLLLSRVTPTGLYFIGRELFGNGFADSLGAMFEQYVGTQLELLEHAEVVGEIEYGKSVQKTVDYFVVTDAAVILVEVKSARPIEAARRGEPGGEADTVKKIGHAYEQIERTAQMIQDRHPAVAEIPADRPLAGLVVTLEPFHLTTSDTFYGDVLTKPPIPTAVISAHELEVTVGALQHAPDAGARLLSSLTNYGVSVIPLRDVAEGLPPDDGNPLLQEAWTRFSAPWDDLAVSVDPQPELLS